MSEPLEASVTLDDVLAVVAAKRVPLAPELAGYLTLEIAEGPAAREGEVDPRGVFVGEEGTVAVVRSKREGDAEASIRALLAKLLEASGTQTPALAAAARKRAGGGVPALVEELEAALIPVNRAAGRRALARLTREVKRVTLNLGRNAMRSASSEVAPKSERPAPAPPSFESDEVPTTARREIPEEVLSEALPSDKEAAPADLPTVGITREELDAAQSKARRDSVDSLLDNFEVSEKREDKALSSELKKIAGLDPTPPPPTARSAGPAEDEGVDALLGATTSPAKPATRPEVRAPKRASDAKLPAARPPQVSYADDRQLPTGPAMRSSVTNEGTGRHKRRRSAVVPILVLLVLLAGIAALLWTLKPGFFTGRTPEKIQEEKLAAEKERERIAALAAQPQCKATLVVSGAPENSEILIRAGVAPVDIERMPVGARLEFVATLDGYAPKRVVVAQNAQWEKGPDGKPRLEVGVQLDKSKKPNVVDPWPPAEPGSEVGGKGDPGTVHLVGTPKGAEVWILSGLGPEARVEQLPKCDADLEVLVAGPTTYRRRITVKSSDFTPDPAGGAGARVANVTVPKK